MFARSIRRRLQLWIAFLLLTVLCGFGVTVYQLQRIHVLGEIDAQLARRIAYLSGELRSRGPMGMRPPPDGPGGRREMPPPEGPGGDRGPRSLGGPGHDREDGPPEPPPGDHGPQRPRGGGPMGGPPWRGRPDAWLESREIRLSGLAQVLFDSSETNGFYFGIWSRGGTLLRQSTNAPASLTRPEPRLADTQPHGLDRGPLREMYQFTELGDCLLVGRNITADLAGLARFAVLLLGAGAAVLALGLGGVGWLASRAIRPIEQIGATAGRISAGNLSERIDVSGTDDELGHLAGVLNSTFARLEAAFAQQKQFTADASHELRTPLAVLISETQTTLSRDRSPEEYRETVRACLDAAQQMRRLTESLLQLARFDAGQEAMHREPVDLADAARDALRRMEPLAQAQGVSLGSELEGVAISADPDRLGQVLTNLLSNAIHYNRPGGSVRIRTALEEGQAVLRVSDTGIGIRAEDLPRIFERFYRADKSRARSEGRSGLGLAIAKAIVEAHAGSIKVESVEGEGTSFTLRFPVIALGAEEDTPLPGA